MCCTRSNIGDSDWTDGDDDDDDIKNILLWKNFRSVKDFSK